MECYSTQAGQPCADEQRCTLIHRDAQGEKPLTKSLTVLPFLLIQASNSIYDMYCYKTANNKLIWIQQTVSVMAT